MPNWKKVIVSGSNAHLNEITSSTFLVDGNQSGNFIAVIDNDQNSNGHVLKLASDGTGNGSYILDMENGTNTMFRARADGRFAFGNSAVTSMGAGTFVVGIDGGHTSDIAISKRLQHLGDSDTYIDFESNKIIFSAGGNLVNYTNNILSGSATATASFGHFTTSGVSTSRITGKSPLVIDSDNFNVDSSGNLSIASNATASFGKVSGSIDVPRRGFIRNSRFRGRSPIAFDTREDDGTATRIEITGSVYASADITGSYLKVDGFKGNWTNAGNTVADLGTITTVDINGGTINGITDLAVADGGTGASTFTDGGVLLGSGTDAITATAVLSNGQLLIGDNSGDPTVGTLTGTTNQVTVTNGAGSITLSTPQDLDTSADVTFDSITLDDLTASRLVSTNGSKKLVSSDLNSFVAGTSNQISVADDGDGTITLSTPQNIHTSATPTFGTITTSGNVTGSSTSTGSFGQVVAGGNIHASKFIGDGSNLTNLPSAPVTALNNATENELVTVGSTTTELDAETLLTWNGSVLGVGIASPSIVGGIHVKNPGTQNTMAVFESADPYVSMQLKDNQGQGIFQYHGSGQEWYFEHADVYLTPTKVSASAATTASFGRLETAGKISGSSLSVANDIEVTTHKIKSTNVGTMGLGTLTPIGRGLTISPDGSISSTSLGNLYGLGITHTGSSSGYFALRITTGQGSIFSVQNNGSVGIGNTNTTHKLDVTGTGRFSDTLEVSGNISGSSTSTGSFGAIRSIGNPLFVDSNRVGINQTSPSSFTDPYDTLVVGNADVAGTGYGITIVTGGSATEGGIAFTDMTGGSRGRITYHQAHDKFLIGAGGNADQLQLNSNGNFGVGGSPTSKLTVFGDLSVSTGDVIIADSQVIKNTNDSLKLQPGSSRDVLLLFGDGNTGVKLDRGGDLEVTNAVSASSIDVAGGTLGNIKVGVTGDNEIDTSSGNLTLDSAGGTITLDDDVIVSGNFTVSGTRTIVDSTTVNIADNIIELNAGTSDGGLFVKETQGGNATGSLLFDVSENYWIAGVKDSEVKLVTISGTDTLTNKSINLANNTITGTTANFNSALSDDSFATLTNSVTLTNKTLTSPDINTPDIDAGTVDGITTLTTGNITSAVALKDSGGNTVITYPAADLGSDAEVEVKIGDVDSATTGTFLSIKPVDEQISVGNADLLVNDIVHQGDTDTKISFTTDQVQFKAGNVNMLTLAESTSDTATFIADTINIGDAVISGSINSSGSFGKLVVGGDFANSGSTVFKVQGQQGTLFSIVDEMSGSIFSANTVAGIPVIEAFSDQKVVLGPASNPITINSSGHITSSAATTASFGRVEVNGSTLVVGNQTINQSNAQVLSNTSGTNTGDGQTTFTLAGDGGSSQTISDSNTLTVAGGDGITTTAGATDTITVALDANLSTVNNLFSTSLKIGASSADEYIDFGTDAMIKFAIDDVEDFRMADGGTFHANADIIAYSSTVASDRNLKTNIIDTKYGLGDVLKLQGREFDWKREDRGHDVGFIAQEVQEVIPELVKEVDSIGENDGDKHLTVDYAKLVPVLVESIKELKKEIEEIKQNCDCLNK